ncbi:MAG: FAD binding domain-containing protein [Ardenticatenaceae bacterium]
MTNSRILAQQFTLHQPKSLNEAVGLLREYDGEARVLAGGTDLLVHMKMGRTPTSQVVYIGHLASLRYIKEENGLKMGALATFYDIQQSNIARVRYHALNEAAHSVSGTQIKIMGSIGGNLCNASPAADIAPPLLVYDGQVELSSTRGSRQVPLREFFTGPGRTVKAADELLTQISLPPLQQAEGSAYLKLGRVAADIAKVSAAVRLVRDGNRVVDCKIALGSVAPTPLRVYRAEKHMIDKEFSEALADEVGKLASQEIKPITDVRSTAVYRTRAAHILVRDGLLMAWRRALGGES